MIKKSIALAVGAVLVVGGLGACWYTGSTFDRIMAEQIAKVKSESGIELSWVEGTHNLFSRDGVLKVVLTAETLARLSGQPAGQAPVEAQLIVTSRLMPLYIKSHLLLDTKQGTLAPVFAKLGMEQWQLGVESVSSLWTQSNSSRFWANEFKVTQGLDQFSFLPLTGEYRGDLSGNGHVSVGWQGMSFHQEQSKLDMTLAALKGNADMAEISGIWLSPRSDLSLGTVSVQLPDSIKVVLQGITTATQLEGDNAQTLSSSYQLKVASLTLENESDNLALTESQLALNLKGLDLEGYQALQEASGQRADEAAIQRALDKMLKRGATLELVDLSSRLNGEPFAIKGEATLTSTSLAQLFNSEEGMQALSGALHASISSQLGKAVPQLAPMLQQFAAMGYLKADQDKLTAELKLDHGAITVNGQPL